MCIQQMAAEALQWFEQITVDHQLVWIRKINTPTWVRDIIHIAQAGFVAPEDWRYAFTVEALSHISKSADPDIIPHRRDRAVEDLHAWFKASESRYAYVGQAAQRFGGCTERGIEWVLAHGLMLEQQEVYRLVLNTLKSYRGYYDLVPVEGME